jgi:GNAT superfamily N-acetyltransferase
MKISAEQLTIREAQERDIPALTAIYAADEVGSHGDTTDPEALADYNRAFDAIAASPNESLYVVELEGEIVGTFQTVILNKLVGRGSVSMAMEAVQTRSDMRGQGIGAIMVDYCIDKARKLDIGMVQLVSNVARLDAHRFYERLGFEWRHFGFRMKLK